MTTADPTQERREQVERAREAIAEQLDGVDGVHEALDAYAAAVRALAFAEAREKMEQCRATQEVFRTRYDGDFHSFELRAGGNVIEYATLDAALAALDTAEGK